MGEGDPEGDPEGEESGRNGWEDIQFGVQQSKEVKLHVGQRVSVMTTVLIYTSHGVMP